jgi:predicted lipoprotein with Yx(FWY)xxD motif
MKRRLTIAIAPAALAGIAIVVAGCGGGSPTAAKAGGYAAGATRAPARGATITTEQTRLGTVLVDGQRRTLYLFEKDKGTTSRCTGACASVWPPLTSAGKSVAGGLSAAKLGSIKRADGKAEVTYGGHPLYTYAGDTKPGDTRGQGLDQFGAEWYVLTPTGNKIDNG